MAAALALATPAGAQQTPDQLPPGQPAPQLDLPPAQKQEPGERFGDWTKKCETRPGTQEENCVLTQLVVHQQNEKRHGVLLVAIGYLGENKRPGVILRVPLALGVYLPGGMTLTVPSVEPMRIVFDACLPSGCSGATPLSDDVITAMKKANGGSVEIRNIRRQNLRLPISFKGFTAGFAALDGK
jgi:invasion protein IalB